MTEAVEPEVQESAGSGEEAHEVGAGEELTGDGSGEALPPVEESNEADDAA